MTGKLKICGVDWTVEASPNIEDYGLCEDTKQRVLINSSYEGARLRGIISHELLHALLHESGAKEIVKGKEEALVAVLEKPFANFLFDNFGIKLEELLKEKK